MVEVNNDGSAADNDVRSDGQLSKRRNVMVVRSESICPTIKVLKLICPTISETRKISFVLQEQSQVNFFVCVWSIFFCVFFCPPGATFRKLANHVDLSPILIGEPQNRRHINSLRIASLGRGVELG